MIRPNWVRVALGQLLRGGIDYGAYLRQLVLWGLFQPRQGELGRIAGFIRTMGVPRVDEREWREAGGVAGETRDLRVEFSGYDPYFAPLTGWHDFLRRELRAMARPRYTRLADSFADIPIALCVRCGNDFAEPALGAKRIGPRDKTPVTWFAQCLDLIRAETGRPVKAVVVSDGTRTQLRDLLDRENVVFARPGSAISDLLILANARILIAAGASSFAAWGAFLGQMPSISHPGQPLAAWGIAPANGQYLAEFDPTSPDPTFLRQATAAI